MKTRILVVVIVMIAGTVAIVSSGVFTPIQSDNPECYDVDENNITQSCLRIDGWYDVLMKSSIQTANNNCGSKYMLVGNNECVLDPKFIEKNTIIIYDVTENSGTRLSIAPHFTIMNLTDNDTVKFLNNGANTVNIFDESKQIWQFENVAPLSHRILSINNTGYYEFIVQNAYRGQTGVIVALSEDTNSLPVETRAQMAQNIISGDFESRIELISIGSGGAEPGITIGINEKFQNKYDDSKKFYYEKYKEMIPFDVPIIIEFSSPITLQSGN